MSDTPETDAQANPVFGNHLCATVLADFARKLERERDGARQLAKEFHADQTRLLLELDRLKQAAKAVVQRWDQPSWKDTEPTAAVINKLRNALGVQEE
jgi:asparagine synthetase B (glutamine-hydrolysing)